jgi:phosphoenolpyruvate carboxykinase (GTP)
MSPFCGYNMADYFSHWLKMGKLIRSRGKVPRVFQVNWFRKDASGNFLWPGFGDNIRVLSWIVDRIAGEVGARDTPLGLLPHDGDVDLAGTEVDADAWDELNMIDPRSWLEEAEEIRRFFARFGDRLPPALVDQLQRLENRLNALAADAGYPVAEAVGAAQ